MKRLLNFLLGFILNAIIFIGCFLTFAIIIKFSLASIFGLFVLQFLISFVVAKILKNKQVRIGIIASLVIALAFLGYNIYKKLSYIEAKSNNYKYKNIEISERDLRLEIMKDTTLSLYDKFTKMKLGKLSDSIVIAFSIKKEVVQKESNVIVNSLNINFSDFHILKIPNPKDVQNCEFLYNDDKFVKVLLKNKEEIYKELQPSNGSDSIVFLGYLPKQSLFVFAQGISEYGINYSSISSITGQEIDGIPLFKSPFENYYCFIHFNHFVGDIDLIIDYWLLDKNSIYKKIFIETIPLNIYKGKDNNLPFSISNITWDKSKFSFQLCYHDSLSFKDEAITIESKIINLTDK